VFRNALEPWHLLILVLVIIVVFGSKKLPDSARALGKSLRILKSETRAMKDENAPPPAQAGQADASAAASSSAPSTASGPGGADQPSVRTIQSAPGDAASARPVMENGTEPR